MVFGITDFWRRERREGEESLCFGGFETTEGSRRKKKQQRSGNIFSSKDDVDITRACSSVARLLDVVAPEEFLKELVFDASHVLSFGEKHGPAVAGELVLPTSSL